MREFFKNKAVTGLVVVATVILAGVAVFTAIKLYQLRDIQVTPTAPESQPIAQQESPPTATPTPCCANLSFALATPTLTPTQTPTPTQPLIAQASPTPTTQLTPTVTPTVTPTTTLTITPTPTTIITSTTTPTSAVELPAAGVSFPTIFAGSIGLLLILLSLFLAL